MLNSAGMILQDSIIKELIPTKTYWYKCERYKFEFINDRLYIVPFNTSETIHVYEPFKKKEMLYKFLNLLSNFPYLKNEFNSLTYKYFIKKTSMEKYGSTEKSVLALEMIKKKIIETSNPILEFVNEYGLFGIAKKRIRHEELTDIKDGKNVYTVYSDTVTKTYDDYIQEYMPNSIERPLPHHYDDTKLFWRNYCENLSEIFDFLSYFYDIYIKPLNFNSYDFLNDNYEYLKKLSSGAFNSYDFSRPYISPVSVFLDLDESSNKSPHFALGQAVYNLIDTIEHMFFKELIAKVNEQKGILLQCKNCNSLYFTYSARNKGFCSDGCEGSYNNKKNRKLNKPLKILELKLLNNKSNDEIRDIIGDRSFASDGRINNIYKVYQLYKDNSNITIAQVCSSYKGRAKKYMTETLVKELIKKIKVMEGENING